MIRQTLRSLLSGLALALSLGLTATAATAATDVNQASIAELEAVKGIGPAMSAKITAARQQGPFKSWADLVERVSGLGPANAARLSQAGLTVAGTAYSAAAEPPAKPARDKKTPAAADARPATKP